MKSRNQANPGKNEYSAEDYGTKNTPEQDLPLRLTGHSKVSEDCQEDKEIIHTQGILDEIGSSE
jgi:hypothetical protein